MRGGRWRESGAARLWVLCAVLLGLVLMHGNPAAAASGCHGAVTVSAGAPDPPATADMTMPAMGSSQGVDAASTGPVVGVSDTDHGASLHDHASTEGGSCLATPARGGLHLPAPGLPAGGALSVLLLMRLGVSIAGGRRGPPDSGPKLLLRVCVART
ncbi:hypothetical protein [Actinacidiphila acidipaludis]|uniref:Secreted protein n=1 Tax=Actinacidiphila acidipaludis TaxID=2873382 RepID=A0ABS7QFT2_9ACTN|nr:hypothetical protein [Streptomyces acidipaludis]MBY8882020.1 hypothetical protein [Streptomyces acidipaludis]